MAIVVGITAWFALRSGLESSVRLVVALDIAGLLFLVLTTTMMAGSNHETARRRAQALDEGQFGVVVFSIGAAVLGLAAIFLETRDTKGLPPAAIDLRLALAAASIVIAWPATHTLFALHYAHRYYGDPDRGTIDGGPRGQRGGLQFPGDGRPDYWDFLYFSFVVGMTCQTSDVQVTGRTVRRVVLFHGVLAFFFNTVVLALGINIAAGLL